MSKPTENQAVTNPPSLQGRRPLGAPSIFPTPTLIEGYRPATSYSLADLEWKANAIPAIHAQAPTTA